MGTKPNMPNGLRPGLTRVCAEAAWSFGLTNSMSQIVQIPGGEIECGCFDEALLHQAVVNGWSDEELNKAVDSAIEDQLPARIATIYRDRVRAGRRRQVTICSEAIAGWLLFVSSVYLFGWAVAWIRRGFAIG